MAKRKPSLNFFKRIFSSRSKRALFIMMAVILFAIVSVVVIYNFIFLVANFTKVLNADTVKKQSPEFDIQGFEKLNLIK